MTGFNHGMTGAVIALAVKEPILAIPLAFASHYLTDMIPHYGPPLREVLKTQFNRFVAADFVFSLFLMIILGLMFPSQKWLTWTCMIAAAITDGIWWFYRKSVRKWPQGLDKFSAWHFKINVQKAHEHHFYFDIAWFLLMWAIVFNFYYR